MRLNAWKHDKLATPEYEPAGGARAEDGLRTGGGRAEDGRVLDFLDLKDLQDVFTPEIPSENQGVCERCHGTGLMASYSSPRKRVVCFCQSERAV